MTNTSIDEMSESLGEKKDSSATPSIILSGPPFSPEPESENGEEKADWRLACATSLAATVSDMSLASRTAYFTQLIESEPDQGKSKRLVEIIACYYSYHLEEIPELDRNEETKEKHAKMQRRDRDGEIGMRQVEAFGKEWSREDGGGNFERALGGGSSREGDGAGPKGEVLPGNEVGRCRCKYCLAEGRKEARRQWRQGLFKCFGRS